MRRTAWRKSCNTLYTSNDVDVFNLLLGGRRVLAEPREAGLFTSTVDDQIFIHATWLIWESQKADFINWLTIGLEPLNSLVTRFNMASTLASQLRGVTQHLDTIPSDIRDAILDAKRDIETSFDPQKAIQVGSRLPEFELPDSSGKLVSSSSLLAKGPILITFYRGEWCPFCNLALRAFQQRLDDITCKGVMFVAASGHVSDNGREERAVVPCPFRRRQRARAQAWHRMEATGHVAARVRDAGWWPRSEKWGQLARGAGPHDAARGPDRDGEERAYGA